MRIDVVRTATQAMVQTAIDTQAYSKQYRMALYTFGKSADKVGLLTVNNLTSSLNGLIGSANSVDLMSVKGQNQNSDQDTQFTNVLTSLASEVGTAGNGKTSGTPKKVVFLVSDGVTDEYNLLGCTKMIQGAGRCQSPIDTKLCQAIKDKGASIAVLYTTYYPLPTNNWYNTWIKPFQSEIGTKMKACASDGLYFEVSPSQGITEAMQAMFLKTASQVRLQH